MKETCTQESEISRLDNSDFEDPGVPETLMPPKLSSQIEQTARSVSLISGQLPSNIVLIFLFFIEANTPNPIRIGGRKLLLLTLLLHLCLAHEFPRVPFLSPLSLSFSFFIKLNVQHSTFNIILLFIKNAFTLFSTTP